MSIPEITIRSMIPADLDQVYALEKTCFAAPWPYSSFEFEINENPAARLWVAEVPTAERDNQIVGMIVAWLLVDEIHIATIAVDPDYRRKQVATRLIWTAFTELLQEGAVSATLEVRESNHAAQNLYRRLGFQPVGKRPGYYQEKGESAVLMTLNSIDPDYLTDISIQGEEIMSGRTS